MEPEALNPWWSIWCVVAREGLDVSEAIRLYTTYSAYAGLEEAVKGSLEPGKLADIVVLSDDPFEIPVEALKDVRVETTIAGARVVHG